MKTIIALAIILLFAPMASADNSVRIMELQEEKTALLQRQLRYQQIMANIRDRIIQIEAIEGELQRQDEAEKQALLEKPKVEGTE